MRAPVGPLPCQLRKQSDVWWRLRPAASRKWAVQLETRALAGAAAETDELALARAERCRASPLSPLAPFFSQHLTTKAGASMPGLPAATPAATRAATRMLPCLGGASSKWAQSSSRSRAVYCATPTGLELFAHTCEAARAPVNTSKSRPHHRRSRSLPL